MQFILLGFYMQSSQEYVNIANRWFDGLISKDINITNEVYSVNSIDFDRQASKMSCCPLDFKLNTISHSLSKVL